MRDDFTRELDEEVQSVRRNEKWRLNENVDYIADKRDYWVEY